MISKELYTISEKGTATLNSDAIEHVYREELKSSQYAQAYSERASAYTIKLKGEKRKRRVYVTPIGNVSVMYLKTQDHWSGHIYCETAVDQALHNV